MYRRVIAPMLMAVGVSVGIAVVGEALRILHMYRLELLMQHRGGWLPPPMLSLDWLVFVVVFIAVHLCGSRGGTRRECILVGVAPLVVAIVGYLALLVWMTGGLRLGMAIGIVPADKSLGAAVSAQTYVAKLLGVVGTCLAATWLYFFTVRRVHERPFWRVG
jgi:hypothetical protein